MVRFRKRVSPLNKAVLTDRVRGAVHTFKTMHDILQEARASAQKMSTAEAEAFWAGPGHRIQRNADLAALSAAAAYKTCVAAGLAANASISDRKLVIAANRYLDQEANRLGRPNGEQNAPG